MGCRCPHCGLRPGSVMSTFSLARRCFKASASKTSALAAIASSKIFFTSFTIWPIFGLSSAGRLPMPRRMSVIWPFLPRYLTRKSFSASTLAAVSSSLSACSLSACSSSLILNLPKFSIQGQAVKIKKPPPLQRGESCITSAVPPCFVPHNALTRQTPFLLIFKTDAPK